MKKIYLLIVVAVMAVISVQAQTNLTGRVYYHPNIMASVFEQGLDIDAKIAEARKNNIAQKEKEKGRKLTKEELAEIDKTVAETKQQMMIAKKCITTAMTVEFTSPTDVVVRQKTKVDDNAMKTMGVSWLKRKAMKAALAVMPESEKMKYEVKGNKVITIDGKDRDTLTLSTDGKTLSGKVDNKTKFILKRTK
ncbi:MAG: hypothetical protein IKX65_06160 [Prevotella sp.]|nr:hypothetical protein [Prevotella sp.]